MSELLNEIMTMMFLEHPLALPGSAKKYVGSPLIVVSHSYQVIIYATSTIYLVRAKGIDMIKIFNLLKKKYLL